MLTEEDQDRHLPDQRVAKHLVHRKPEERQEFEPEPEPRRGGAVQAESLPGWAYDSVGAIAAESRRGPALMAEMLSNQL